MPRFLASVGVGNLYRRVNNELQMVAHVNTLTESTLSITSTQEEVRAGQGAKLYGRFNHDAGLTVTLTDAMFDMNYIAMQVGSELKQGGITMFTEQLTVGTGGLVTLTKKPDVIGESCGLDEIIVWYRLAGCDASEDYKSKTLEEGAMSFTDAALTQGATVCVSYFTADISAKTVLVNANFVPSELVLVLTTALYAGDASAPETGRPVGEITIKIPRFSLDGAFDLSMAMSSAATMSLNGTALATAANDCEGDGVYAEIVEYIAGDESWAQKVDALAADGVEGDAMTQAEVAIDYVFDVYATFENGDVYPVSADLLTFDAGETGAAINEAGKVTTAATAAGTITITLKANPEKTLEITVS